MGRSEGGRRINTSDTRSGRQLRASLRARTMGHRSGESLAHAWARFNIHARSNSEEAAARLWRARRPRGSCRARKGKRWPRASARRPAQPDLRVLRGEAVRCRAAAAGVRRTPSADRARAGRRCRTHHPGIPIAIRQEDRAGARLRPRSCSSRGTSYPLRLGARDLLTRAGLPKGFQSRLGRGVGRWEGDPRHPT